MKPLLGAIARSLVDRPDRVRVDEYREAGAVCLDLEVDAVDRGRVIGRSGRTADALRTLLSAVGRRKGVRVRLEIVD